jgi:3-oxoacyl-[acyl-carrier protein] reductase
MQSGRLSGKIALVTGAASGIGLATVQRFAAEGACVVAVDIAAESARDRWGTDVTAMTADVSSASDVERAVREVKGSFGRIDALAHFAGITRDARLEKLTLDAWEEVLRVNLTGTFLIAQAVARMMIEQRAGSIVLTSSRSYLGNFGQSNYAASKGGVVSLTRTLALELGKHGVRVNALAPGFIETPMTDAIPEKVRGKALEGTPLGRSGKPEEVAAVTLFLASDDSSYVTGQILFVDGGRTTGLAPA